MAALLAAAARAASSQLAQRVTAAVVAILESAGLVEQTADKYIRPLIPPEDLLEHARAGVHPDQAVRGQRRLASAERCVEQPLPAAASQVAQGGLQAECHAGKLAQVQRRRVLSCIDRFTDAGDFIDIIS